MPEATVPALSAWASFYVIVGSSAAALTGLQFVVIALLADSRQSRTMREIDAFGTPTIVHFCAALFVSALLSAPWSTMPGVAGTLGVTGAGGVGYTLVVARRARRQTAYTPVFEDWLWHVGLVLAAYGILLIGAVLLIGHARSALFMIATTTLLLVFIGIHNAWDTVTYIAVDRSGKARSAVSESTPRGDRGAPGF
ncbi:MAG: hypothetical protein NVS4B3_22590 [Gemmatimonadaceae bacterium]